MNPSIAAGDNTVVDWHEAGTLWGLFNLRVRRSPEGLAYRDFVTGSWRDHSWSAIARRVELFRAALAAEKLNPGDRVAILLLNGIDWVCLDIAAHGCGLVTVGLYPQDTAASNAFIIGHCDARLLLADTGARWEELRTRRAEFPLLQRVWIADRTSPQGDPLAQPLADVLAAAVDPPTAHAPLPGDLATLIYTSGTTGRPKGVMLSHTALLANAAGVASMIPPRPDDVFLSILPLAHAFERTVGFYVPMIGGSAVAFSRSVQDLREDLAAIRPTAILAVPRLFERMAESIASKVGGSLVKRAIFRIATAIGWRRFEAEQQRRDPGLVVRLLWPLVRRHVAQPVLDAFGGRLRIAVSGGATLDPAIARQIIGLGIPVVEGYGLTEAAPVVAANALENNVPGSVGMPLPGVEVKLGEGSELLVHSLSMMTGYWKGEAETARVLGADGWLSTGDIAEIKQGRIYIRGRVKETIVLSIGEKINPVAVETEMLHDPLFAQVAVMGAGRPFPIALAVLNEKAWDAFAAAHGLAADRPNAAESIAALLPRVAERLSEFPRFAQIRALHLVRKPWTIEAGLMTPTLKVKRDRLQALFANEIDALYAALRAASEAPPSG